MSLAFAEEVEVVHSEQAEFSHSSADGEVLSAVADLDGECLFAECDFFDGFGFVEVPSYSSTTRLPFP